MSVYFVSKIRITDESVYNTYLDSADEVFSEFSGEYLAADTSPQKLEGMYNGERIIIMRFNSESDLHEWYFSPAYRDILKYRLEGADCESYLVKGKD